jgi:hypothetical protein
MVEPEVVTVNQDNLPPVWAAVVAVRGKMALVPVPAVPAGSLSRSFYP